MLIMGIWFPSAPSMGAYPLPARFSKMPWPIELNVTVLPNPVEKDILSRYTNEHSCFDIQSPAVPKTTARLDVDEARTGVPVDGGVKERSAQPAIPSALVTDSAMTPKVGIVAETERRRRTMVRVITRYIVGTSVAMSFMADS